MKMAIKTGAVKEKIMIKSKVAQAKSPGIISKKRYKNLSFLSERSEDLPNFR